MQKMKSQRVEMDSEYNMPCLLSQLERRNALSVTFFHLISKDKYMMQ